MKHCLEFDALSPSSGVGTLPQGSGWLRFQVFLLWQYHFPHQVSLISISRLKTALAKRTGRPEVEMQGPEEGLGRRRSSRIMEETSGMEEEEEEETTIAAHGRRSRRDGEVLAPDHKKLELENGL